jgi:hypothetical protein
MIGSIHFPTPHMVVEDIVELLIREFQVDPLRANWEEVLNAFGVREGGITTGWSRCRSSSTGVKRHRSTLMLPAGACHSRASQNQFRY